MNLCAYIGYVLFSQTVHKDIYEMLLKIKESLELTKQYTDDQIKQAASQGWVVGLGVHCSLSGVGCGAGCPLQPLRGGLWGWVSIAASWGWVMGLGVQCGLSGVGCGAQYIWGGICANGPWGTL